MLLVGSTDNDESDCIDCIDKIALFLLQNKMEIAQLDFHRQCILFAAFDLFEVCLGLRCSQKCLFECVLQK